MARHAWMAAVAALGLAACATPETATTPADLRGAWLLTRLGQMQIRTPITLNFDGERASGVAPCNSFAGSYRQDGAALSIGPLVATRRACPDLAMEDAYLSALTDVVSFTRDGTFLTLLGPEDRVVARFKAAGA